jgi:hypothetical protein
MASKRKKTIKITFNDEEMAIMDGMRARARGLSMAGALRQCFLAAADSLKIISLKLGPRSDLP